MEFRREKAVETLRLTAGALTGLDAPLRGEVEALIRQHGPLIAAAESYAAAGRVLELLNALGELAPRLPAAAVAALQAGQAPPASVGRGVMRGGMEMVADADRVALLRALAGVYDFRVFLNPADLAADLIALVRGNDDRLTDAELAEWRALLHAYEGGGDATTFLRGAGALLGGYTKVTQLLDAGKAWAAPGPGQGRTVYRGVGTEAQAVSKGLFGPPTPTPNVPSEETLDRYVNLYFQGSVLLSQCLVPLIVHIAREYAEAGGQRVLRQQARRTLRPGDVTLVLHAEGFEVVESLGGQSVDGALTERIVTIERDRDAEPVIFFLNPLAVGRKRISLDLVQFGRIVATPAFEVEVGDGAALGKIGNIRLSGIQVISPSEGAQPPDLLLRVTVEEERRLVYTLHTPATRDYNFRRMGSVTLNDEPRRFLQPVFDKLSQLAQLSLGERSAAQTAQARQELADVGINLYSDLFPAEFKLEYPKIKAKFAGGGLLITSDESAIPWEMVHPYYADGVIPDYDDGVPLCETFCLTRWLAGPGTPDRLALRRGAFVAPADNLAAAKTETDYFEDLHRRQWDVTLLGPLGTLGEFDARFRSGDTEMFHFACHGNFNTDDPNESKLKLAAGEVLRPSQITGPKQTGLRRAKPLVFLNACHSGQGDVALTQLGGWAERFLAAGASAFIGSLWEINDVLAAQFAREFYNRLWGVNGQSQMALGAAFHAARMAIKAADDANPTWLAYVLYGDPYGQVHLGQ